MNPRKLPFASKNCRLPLVCCAMICTSALASHSSKNNPMSCTASAYIQSLHDDHWKMNIHKLHCKTPYPHEKYQITFYAAIKGWTDESLIPVEKLSSKGDIDIQNASYTVHCFRGSGTYYGEIESIDSEGIKNGDEKIFYRQWTKCDR